MSEPTTETPCSPDASEEAKSSPHVTPDGNASEGGSDYLNALVTEPSKNDVLVRLNRARACRMLYPTYAHCFCYSVHMMDSLECCCCCCCFCSNKSVVAVEVSILIRETKPFDL